MSLLTRYNHVCICCTVDLCAIPDFAIGAMENWGLITYRESALLVDPLVASSASQKQRVAIIVAHELVHQVVTITLLYSVVWYIQSVMLVLTFCASGGIYVVWTSFNVLHAYKNLVGELCKFGNIVCLPNVPFNFL